MPTQLTAAQVKGVLEQVATRIKTVSPFRCKKGGMAC